MNPRDASHDYEGINGDIARGRLDHAERLLRAIIVRTPDAARAHFLLGRVAAVRGDPAGELAACERAVARDPREPEYLAQLGHCLLKADRVHDALEAADAAQADPAANDQALNVVAMIYARLNLHDRALPVLERAAAFGNRNPAILLNLATARKYCGQLAAAEQDVRLVIAMIPDHLKARAALSALRRATLEDNQLSAYRRLLDQVRDPAARLHISHAAADECDQLGRYDEAYALLAGGKAGILPPQRADFALDGALFEAIRAGFERAGPATGLHGPRPIFVVGMPRSGTTVVERLLSADPTVGTVGESLEFGRILQRRARTVSPHLIDPGSVAGLLADRDVSDIGRAYLDRLPPLPGGRTRPLDKFHLNVLLAGFIARALPDARIVCVVRNPLDTIWGNYRRLFEYRSAVYRYAFSLETLARFYVEFRRLSDYWARAIPDGFRIVSYDRLVDDPAGEARSMFAFCGLDWDDRYLRIEDNPAPAASASAVQVRQGLNRGSIGGWRRYMRHLAPAQRILTDAGIDWN